MAFDSAKCVNISPTFLTVLLPLASNSNFKTSLNKTTAIVFTEHSISKELVFGTICLWFDDQFDNQSEVFSFSAKELKMCI